jgi:hypothetical protein
MDVLLALLTGFPSCSVRPSSSDTARERSSVPLYPQVPEAISKHQMAFEGKAKADEKAQHTREYVSILHKPPGPPQAGRPQVQSEASA